MGYKVDYGSMQQLVTAYSSAASGWEEGINGVLEKAEAICSSKNISGNQADRMKAYMDTVYSFSNTSLAVMLQLFRQNFLLYLDAYYREIDSNRETVIKESELSEIHSTLQGKRSQMQQIALSAEQTAKSVLDIVGISSLDLDKVDSKFDKILASLNDLDSDINGLESQHVSADFTELDGMISNFGAYVQEMYLLKKEFKTSFSMESFLSLTSVPLLAANIQSAYSQLQAQESSVKTAAKNLEKRLKQEQEAQQKAIKKRQEQAGWAKVGVNVTVGLITTVALVTTGPLGAVAVAGVSGTVTAAFSAAADEYVTNAWDMKAWDVNKIQYHGAIGGITGMIGAAVVPGAGPCVKSGVKALSSMVEGVASTSYDQIAVSGKITDVRAIAKDALLKGGSTFVGSMLGNAVNDNVSDFIKKDKTIKELTEHVVGGSEHFKAVVKVEGAAALTSGVVKRFSSTAVTETGGFVEAALEGKSLEEAYEEHDILGKSIQKAADVKSITEDAAGAVTKAATDNPMRDNLKKLDQRQDDYYLFGDSPDLNGKEDGWKDWNSEEYDRMTAKLAEMDARGEDAREYEIFGDPRTLKSQRTDAVNKAWKQERRLVMQGRGTRDWTVSQQEELIRTGKVSGFEGSHMLDVSSNPLVANNPDNIQFLTHAEHIQGAHNRNTKNPTTGRFDPATGETETINARQIPHREETAFELTDTFDYKQADLADQLGSEFGYGRGK